MGHKALTTIVYIDDEPDIRHVVELSLNLADGLAVHTGESGQRALELARDLKPDLMMLDVMMPGMDGPETLRRLRAEPELADIPIFFMTAKAMPAELQRLRALGAAAIIPKPFDPMKLATDVLALWEKMHTSPPGS
jgi:CheY-like chemotaxis protein